MRFGEISHRFLVITAALVTVTMLGTNVEVDTLSVQAKSFIATVNLADTSQFDADAKSCEQAMAALVDCGMKLGENPTDGSKPSGNYRLRSELSINVTCSGNKISSWQLDPVNQDFGTEFVIFSTSGDLIKPLKASPSLKGNVQADKVTFSYRLRGRPNAAGVDVMNRVKPRTCSYIWHGVRTRRKSVDCRQTASGFEGSSVGRASNPQKLQ
jgi:hypothetical protein